ncbi:MAG: PQQ-like beta-propeller repeat protein [Euryarchaeota archaeon]|nr:PQQ-like beta-propeller repeat protein [Euryarchaeota archaeon]
MSEVWDAKTQRVGHSPTVVADISEFAWFVRDMPAAATAVLLGQTRLYAGDWDGNLRAWSEEGKQLWIAEAEDRVERMCGARDAESPFICATAGSQISSLDAASGEMRWIRQLVGSSDLVVCSDDGSRVLATSSVYEIELNDFIETTCWRFDADGESVREDTFEERPWHLLLDEKGVATMGIGRPRCGLITQNDNESNHINLAEDNPILCGSTIGDKTIFGHASGLVTMLKENSDGLIELDSGHGDSVHTLHFDGTSIIAGGDDGEVRSISTKGDVKWSENLGSALDECTIGFEIGGEKSCWVGTWDGLNATLWVLSGNDGKTLLQFTNLSRIRALASREDRVVIGLDDGRVLLFNQELFCRRLNDNNNVENNSDNNDDEADDSVEGAGRLSLQERLRALRK